MMRVMLLPLLLLTSIACGQEKTGYSGPFEAQVRRAIPQIEATSGLTFKRPPKLELRTRDEVREFLEKQFNEQLTPLQLAGTEQAYQLLGLLPDTLDLRAFLLDLLTEQVAGYYDPATKVLYIVSGAPADITGVTISHELVHALQDQYVPLDSTQGLKGDNDRQVAMQAVIEGQAVFEQMSSSLGGMDFGLRVPGGWDRVRQMIRESQGSMPLFASAPTIIQETLLFPYLSGAEFVRQVKQGRPGVPPFQPFAASTEQILHPEKFLGATPDLPTRITMPASAAGSLVHEDNLGEFETRLFLFEHLKDVGLAAAGAAGWDGDRYQVINTSAGAALSWVTVWDSAVEAVEFRDLLERMVERRFSVARGSGGTGDSRRWTAKGRALRVEMTEVQGRAVVLWSDAPMRVAVQLTDPRRLQLQEDSGGR